MSWIRSTEPLAVLRATVSRESGATLGVLFECRCRLCGAERGPDTETSLLNWIDRHLRKEHGRHVERLVDVRLGEEHW